MGKTLGPRKGVGDLMGVAVRSPGRWDTMDDQLENIVLKQLDVSMVK